MAKKKDKTVDWKYNGKKIDSIEKMPKDTHGFCYRIDIELDGQDYFYIGKKKLISRRKKKFTKKQIAEMPNKRAKKWFWEEKEMPWQSYTGSNKTLNELLKKHGAEKVKLKKTILHYCKSELELKYREAVEILCSSGLELDNCFNDGCSLRQYGKLKF